MRRTKAIGKRQKRKVVFRRQKQSNAGSILIMAIVAVLLVVVKIRSAELNDILVNYEDAREQLMVQIEEEEFRKELLDEEQKRMQTKQFAEEIAKDSLGLVYENEIIFMLEE